MSAEGTTRETDIMRPQYGGDPNAPYMMLRTVLPKWRASLAIQFLPSLMVNETLRDVMSDDDRGRLKAEAIARRACDLADAILRECGDRDWLLYLDENGHAIAP